VNQQSDVATENTVVKEPPITLRDFAEFSVANGTISLTAINEFFNIFRRVTICQKLIDILRIQAIKHGD